MYHDQDAPSQHIHHYKPWRNRIEWLSFRPSLRGKRVCYVKPTLPSNASKRSDGTIPKSINYSHGDIQNVVKSLSFSIARSHHFNWSSLDEKHDTKPLSELGADTR